MHVLGDVIKVCVGGSTVTAFRGLSERVALAETVTEVTPVGPDSLNTGSCSAVTKRSVYLDWGARCAGDKGEAKKRLSYRNFN